ncbi:hypothetical protein K0H71_21025 [Bacillus sp. IITD106]|nr:hypothetical protein [Bacillus sp. IITD106]
MKLSYDDSFDKPLKELNSQIVWGKERKAYIHSQVMLDIDRLHVKARRKKIFAMISYGMAFSIMLLLGFNYVVNENFLTNEGKIQDNIEKPAGAKLTKEEQMATNTEYYEWKEIDGRRTLTFNEYGLKNSVIPLNAKEKIPTIISDPIVFVDNLHGRGYVMHAFYDTVNHYSISVHNQFNEIGTADETVDYFLEAYGTEELQVANKRAVFSSTGVQIYIPTDTYIWYISGKTKEEMIALANLFRFDE